MNQYWIDFWSSFMSGGLATIGGLIIGLPVALWTDRLIKKRELKIEKDEELKILNTALGIIRDVIDDNFAKLGKAYSTIQNEQVQTSLRLNTSAWDATKHDILKSLHNPDLKRNIAYHFEKLHSVETLNSLYLEKATGVSVALSGNKDTREVFKQNLIEEITSLINESDELKKSINIQIK